MSLSEIIPMLGCFMCAAYAITFVMLGCGLTVEIWRDRHRELKAPIPAIRSAVSVPNSSLLRLHLDIGASSYCRFYRLPCV